MGFWYSRRRMLSCRLVTTNRNLGPFISGLVWMHSYSHQCTCVGVDWGEIKLNSILIHSHTYGLMWIQEHPKKISKEKNTQNNSHATGSDEDAKMGHI